MSAYQDRRRVTGVYAGFVLTSPMDPSALAADLAAKGQGKTPQEVLDTGQTLVLQEVRPTRGNFQTLCKGMGSHPNVTQEMRFIYKDHEDALIVKEYFAVIQ